MGAFLGLMVASSCYEIRRPIQAGIHRAANSARHGLEWWLAEDVKHTEKK
jgi:hypothetical protein